MCSAGGEREWSSMVATGPYWKHIFLVCIYVVVFFLSIISLSIFIRTYINKIACALAFAFKTVTLANWNFRINEFIDCACTDNSILFYFSYDFLQTVSVVGILSVQDTDGLQECNVRFCLIHRRSRWFLFVCHCSFFIMILFCLRHMNLVVFHYLKIRFCVSDSTFRCNCAYFIEDIFRY